MKLDFQMLEEYPRFVDLEASGLHWSGFPIEVAWNDPDGEIHSYLIDPALVTDWDENNPIAWALASQDVHGITKQILYEQGSTPQEVAERLNQGLKGSIVLSDAPNFDERWLDQIFEQSDIDRRFFVQDIIPELDKLRSLDEAVWDIRSRIARAEAVVEQYCIGRGLPRHRAENDVIRHLLLYQLLYKQREYVK